MNFSEKLRQLLQKMGISQRVLCDKIDVSPALLSAYVKGKQLPTMSTMVKIADFFNVSIDELIGRTMNSSDMGLILEEEKRLVQKFRKLNSLGQQEVIKRVEELNCMEKYKIEEKENKKIVFAAYGGNGVEYREVNGEQAEKLTKLLSQLSDNSINVKHEPETEEEKRTAQLLDRLMYGDK